MRRDEQTGPRDRRESDDDDGDTRLRIHRRIDREDNHFSTYDDDRAGRTWGGMSSRREPRDARFAYEGGADDDDRYRDSYEDRRVDRGPASSYRHVQESKVHFAHDPRFGEHSASSGRGSTHDRYAGERYRRPPFRPVGDIYRGFVRGLDDESDRDQPGGLGRDADSDNTYARDPRDDRNRFSRRRRF